MPPTAVQALPTAATPGVPLSWYLILSAILFTTGVVGVLIKRNPLVIFMCIELMLNSVNLSLIAFSRYLGDAGGLMLTIFVMAVAAAEVAVGLAIIVDIFRSRHSVDIDDVSWLRG